MNRSLVVVKSGPLSLVQDLGRPGSADIGVGRSGAADRASAAAANRLVGNRADAAVLETTFGGLAVRAESDVLVALTGAPCPLTIDGGPAVHGTVLRVAAGQVLAMRTPAAGLRSYLAIRGGVAVEPVLGSRSTDTLAGLGPAPLRRGDVIPIGEPGQGDVHGAIGDAGSNGTARDAAAVRPVAKDPAAGPTMIPAAEVITLRAMLGPRDDWFADPAVLAEGEWVVSPHSNRVGLRLDRPSGADPPTGSGAPRNAGPALRRKDSRELPSEGVVPGAVQVPPSGQPVVFLADHPVTGGYPVIAVVLDADVDLAAQARPGQRVRFELAMVRPG